MTCLMLHNTVKSQVSYYDDVTMGISFIILALFEKLID